MLALARPGESDNLDEVFCGLQPAPQIIGRIKTDPEDFVVTESLPFTPDGTGEHIFLQITKRETNTGWLARQLATFLGVRDFDVSFAGRKDKYAVTTQWFSCYLPGENEINWSAFSEPGVTIDQVTRHRSKLRRGDLAHNRFDLLVRHDPISDDARADIEARLTYIAENGFPNYFGAQRFGRDGSNLEKADVLLKSELEQPATRGNKRARQQRGRSDQPRNRGMLLSAARSWLFNRYLCDQIVAAEPLDDRDGPLIGKSRDPQAGENEMNETERTWTAGLRHVGMKVDSRALLSHPDEFTWQFEDTGLRLGFTLGAGSYATSLLKEVFVIEDCARDH